MARRRLMWAAVVLGVAASMATAVAAYELAGYSWNQVVDYRSPFADYERPWAVERPTSSAEETAGPRLVLVIVDGLTLDASHRMAGLETVRGYGADMVAETPQPSLSFPTWTNIVSGAPPQISGVTTNWFEGPVPVETVLDLAIEAGKRTVAVGPDDLDALFGASRADGSYLRPHADGEYMSGDFITHALQLIEAHDPQFVLILLPDADDAAHDHGPESDEYAQVTARIDTDIARLVSEVQDPRTTFVITADHGHVRGGGHGGWEPEATHVPAIFFGGGVTLNRGDIAQEDIAPTMAALMGTRMPTHSAGRVRAEVLADDRPIAAGEAQYREFAERFVRAIGGSESDLAEARSYDEVASVIARASADRLAQDRRGRSRFALAVAGGAMAVLVLVGLASWRALVAAASGVLTYYGVYDGLYFLVHGHRWSLSAFNTESYLSTFFNLRMAEAAAAGLVAAGVAALVYPLLRREPKGPVGGYRGGWFALGPATVLVVQATLAAQVAWFLWAWGAQVTWRLPDLKWGFKYDLDLVQATALGAAALLAPLVTLLVARYHPRMRRPRGEGDAGGEGAPVPSTPATPAGVSSARSEDAE